MTESQWADILKDWKMRVSHYQEAQYVKARALESRHYGLGIPAVVLSAIAGTTVFANLNKDFPEQGKVTVVIISLLTAILTAVQTFMNYGKRSETYRSVSSRFGAVRTFLLLPVTTEITLIINNLPHIVLPRYIILVSICNSAINTNIPHASTPEISQACPPKP